MRGCLSRVEMSGTSLHDVEVVLAKTMYQHGAEKTDGDEQILGDVRGLNWPPPLQAPGEDRVFKCNFTYSVRIHKPSVDIN